MACLSTKMFDIAWLSIPVWHAHLSSHTSHASQHPSRFKDSRAWGEQAVREAVHQAGRLAPVQQILIPVFKLLTGKILDSKRVGFLHGRRCSEESEKLTRAPNLPHFTCAITYSGAVMFGFPVRSRLPQNLSNRGKYGN